MTESAYLKRINVLLARHNLHRRQPIHEVQLLPDAARVSLDLNGEETSREAAAVREHADPLPLQLLRLDTRHQTRQAAVERRGVHVTATLGAGHRRGDFGFVGGSRVGNKGLLESFVGEGIFA